MRLTYKLCLLCIMISCAAKAEVESADYQAGVDVDGEAVVSADLEPDTFKPPTKIKIPVAPNMNKYDTEYYDLDEPEVGNLEVDLESGDTKLQNKPQK